MRKYIYLLAYFVILFCGCQKEYSQVNVGKGNAILFTTYFIKAGTQYANNDSTSIILVETNELKFVAKFDSSAKYATRLTANQADVNKLYGFSDNKQHHHQFSARIGWAWYNNALRLYGYTYNNGIRNIEEITTVNILEDITCSIKIIAANYVFTVNNKSIQMPRMAVGNKAIGYKLFPYFGGDELAPQDITILLKEVL